MYVCMYARIYVCMYVCVYVCMYICVHVCMYICASSVQLSLSHVHLFVTPWTAARQPSLSITNSWNLLKLMSIQSVMTFNHLILWSSTSPPAFNLSQLLTNQIHQNIKVAYFRNASLFWHSKKSRQFAILTESRRKTICAPQ